MIKFSTFSFLSAMLNVPQEFLTGRDYFAGILLSSATSITQFLAFYDFQKFRFLKQNQKLKETLKI